MSDSSEKPQARGGGPSLIAMVLPAVFAAAAAFGGAKVAGAHHAPAAASAEHAEAPKPPGPTLALEPFLLAVADTNRKAHPMKVTIAIEFDALEKEEALKGLTPRIRDAALGYLRTLSYEAAIDPAGGDKLRSELLERVRTSGTPSAEHVLITDLVIQ
jgi:flagellar basal body-associated protein FliL